MILYQLTGPNKVFDIFRERIQITNRLLPASRKKQHLSFDQIKSIHHKKVFVMFDLLTLELKDQTRLDMLFYPSNNLEFVLKFINRQIESFQKSHHQVETSLLTNVKDLVQKKKSNLDRSA